MTRYEISPIQLVCFALLPLVLVGPVSAPAAAADARVELVIVGSSQVNAEFHQWMQSLGAAGIDRVRFEGGKEGDRPGIATERSGDRTIYIVTGVLTDRAELIVPGARFRRSEAARLAAWLKDVGENGPPDRREATSAFGLTARQLAEVKKDLRQPVGVATAGQPRGAVARKLAAQLAFPVRFSSEAAGALGTDPVAEDFAGFSTGAALACVLRPAGLAMAPVAAKDQMGYVVATASRDREQWPIGWPPEKLARDVLPAMFEFHNVNIQDVPLSTAIEAITKQVRVPAWFDHNALARYEIDPAKTNINLPSGRTTYSLTLQKALFQARLKYEVRLDEAGKPFFWITSVKPLK